MSTLIVPKMVLTMMLRARVGVVSRDRLWRHDAWLPWHVLRGGVRRTRRCDRYRKHSAALGRPFNAPEMQAAIWNGDIVLSTNSGNE